MQQTEFNWRDFSTDEVCELLRRNAAGSSQQSCTGFLDLHQYCPLLRDAAYSLVGGHESAQFRRAGAGDQPPAVCCWTLPAFGVAPELRSARKLRQYLQRTGIEDSQLGDIVCGDQVWIFATERANLDGVFTGIQQVLPPASFSGITVQRTTCASLRLDAVVSAVFHVSRGEAQTAIEYGFVFYNWEAASKASRPVVTPGSIVYRTKGRCQLLSARLNDRSKRNILEFELYPC